MPKYAHLGIEHSFHHSSADHCSLDYVGSDYCNKQRFVGQINVKHHFEILDLVFTVKGVSVVSFQVNNRKEI